MTLTRTPILVFSTFRLQLNVTFLSRFSKCLNYSLEWLLRSSNTISWSFQMEKIIPPCPSPHLPPQPLPSSLVSTSSCLINYWFPSLTCKFFDYRILILIIFILLITSLISPWRANSVLKTLRHYFNKP